MTPKTFHHCVTICRYLGRYDADIDTLAAECDCAVQTVRRAIRALRECGIHILHIRHRGPDGGVAHYWGLARALRPGEAAAYLARLYAPEEEAQALLQGFLDGHKSA